MKSIASSGVHVYDLSVGKTLPDWLTPQARQKLAKDEEYRRRVELLQDFEFKTASQRIQVSKDGYHVFVTGTYPPMVKVYDVRELSLKFERHLDAQVVQFQILSDDYSKVVFLGDDRSLSFHAAYGFHYKVRVPRFGRDLAYNDVNCELYVCGSTSEVYRMNLELGRFTEPVDTKQEANNVMAFSTDLALLLCGSDAGVVSSLDMRAKPTPLSTLHVDGKAAGISAMKFDEGNALNVAIGTNAGKVLLYDLRSSKPVVVKQHPHGLPIVSLDFHNTSRRVISADTKVIKIWERDSGDAFTTVEAQGDINEFCTVKRRTGETSGLLLAAGETERVMSFYVPRLGTAPNWCAFLDNLTEELEEKEAKDEEIYENYKFVTKQDLERLGVSHLIGSQMLRAYMHGYFMDAKLYQRVKAVSEPDAFETWRKNKIKEKLEAKVAQRIKPKRKAPKVNKSLAKRTGEEISKDDRFKDVFNDPDFEIDEESDRFKQVFPSGFAEQRQSGEEDSEYEDESDDDAVIEAKTEEPKAAEVERSDKSSKQKRLRIKATSTVLESGAKKKRKAKKSMAERLKEEEEVGNVKYLGAGNVELSFVPKS